MDRHGYRSANNAFAHGMEPASTTIAADRINIFVLAW